MLAEIAPLLVPEFDALLILLLRFLAAIIALGMLAILLAQIRATVGLLGALLGHIPVIGGVLASPVNAVVHWLDYVFSEVVEGLDVEAGRFFHQLGDLARWISREIRTHGHLLWLLSSVLLGPAFAAATALALHRIRVLVARVEHQAAHAAKVIAREALRPEIALLHRLHLRLNTITHVIDGTITADLGWLRHRARRLERDYENLFKRIRRLDYLLGAAAFAGAVAYAIERLGLSWIKCKNWKTLGRAGCSLPFKLIEDLFAGFVDVLLITDLCAIVRYMMFAAQEAQPVLDLIVTGMDELLACRNVDRPPPLILRHVSPPPPATGVKLTLAA